MSSAVRGRFTARCAHMEVDGRLACCRGGRELHFYMASFLVVFRPHCHRCDVEFVFDRFPDSLNDFPNRSWVFVCDAQRATYAPPPLAIDGLPRSRRADHEDREVRAEKAPPMGETTYRQHLCHTSAMLPAMEPATGWLPVGRYLTDITEVNATYVDAAQFATSTTRAEIWQHFESATAELRRIVPVAYVWIAGSFITNTMDPDDIDVVYWCEDRLVDAVTDLRDKQILEMFSLNSLRATTGLRVDTRYGRWNVHPNADSTPDAKHLAYAQMRGFWDDFWLRARSGAKSDPRVRMDALPRRGYLEVTLDGVHVV